MSKHVTSASLTSVKDTTSPALSPDVFARYIQQYQDAGYRLAYSLLGQRQAAEDAVQEAALHAWEARERYDETKGTFSAWFLCCLSKISSLFRRITFRWQVSCQLEKKVGVLWRLMASAT